MILASLALSMMGATPVQGEKEVRQAVERSLPYLEAKGVAWIRNRKCASCHHVPFLIWSHREARDRGLAVDARKLDEWTRWATEFSLTAKTPEGRRNGGGLDTMAQLLLARPPAPKDTSAREMAELILGQQKPEGFWEAGGQLPSQRRPLAETHDVSTMWVLHSLPPPAPGQESWKESREKAVKWLAERKPGKSNESLAVHLLTASGERSEGLLRELLARQNADGGWGWLAGEAGDAFATGQSLYALSLAGVKADAEPVRRAREFLVKTQGEDGSWVVRSTKPKSKDTVIASYWGTAWAAIGLLHTLPARLPP